LLIIDQEGWIPVSMHGIRTGGDRDAVKREYGREIGFKWVESNPLVRSSYHAEEQATR